MRLHVLAISLLLLASASCASAEASQPGSISEADEATVRQLAREGTSPPHGAERPVGVTSEQHLDAIEEAVRRATRQLDSNERIHAVADLRAVWWSEPFQKEDSFGSPPELRRWAAWLVWDEYRRSVGRWGHNLADVERMKVIGEKLPPLLNAADITRPKDWVDAFISPDRRNGGDQIP